MTRPRTRIVATLGPSTDAPGVLESLVEAGVSVVRLNLSHGDTEDHRARIERVRALPRPPSVLVDTRGPEVRVDLPPGALKAGEDLSIPDVAFSPSCVLAGLSPGNRLLLGDGGVVLEVTRSTGGDIGARVLSGGRVGGAVRVTLPEEVYREFMAPRSVLTPADREDILDLVPRGVDFVALSMVRSADDVLNLRGLLEESGLNPSVVAKIEMAGAVDDIDSIMEVSDALMVARGDLGLRLPPEDVPLVQKELIRRANREGIPVITATQMLESMISAPAPTRAEAGDVANAILDGTDAVMLSGETAVGAYPREAVSMMARIAARTEGALPGSDLPPPSRPTITDVVGRAAHTAAAELGAAAVITATRSGYTARMVARFRPRARLIAATPSDAVARELALVWGVSTLVVQPASSTDEVLDGAVDAALQAGLVESGDLLVLTAGLPPGISGTTNVVKVEVAAGVLSRGAGIGRKVATAPVYRPGEGEAPDRFILVAESTDAGMVPLIQRSSGIVTGEGGLTSHGAVVGLSLGLPTVVGARIDSLTPGRVVTLDAGRGLVYDGEVRVPGGRDDERGNRPCF